MKYVIETLELKEYKGSKFRFNSQKVFLTYPNLPTKLRLGAFKRQLNLIAEIKRYCISKELHKNGRAHIHAYLEFFEKQDFKSETCFDLIHYGRRHPNIQKPKSFHKLIRYIKKDGDYITNLPNHGIPEWKRLLAIEDEKEFLEEILWTNGGGLTSYANIKLLQQIRDFGTQTKPVKYTAEMQWKDFGKTRVDFT